MMLQYAIAYSADDRFLMRLFAADHSISDEREEVLRLRLECEAAHVETKNRVPARRAKAISPRRTSIPYGKRIGRDDIPFKSSAIHSLVVV